MIEQRDNHFTFSKGWLLWLALAAVACLPPLDITPFGALLVAATLVSAWIFVNVSPKRLICTTLIGVLEVFFREIGARNQFKVPPQNVPCIFVCAPHSNQFLDPFVVMNAVGRMDLCFLAAAKSMRLRFVGLLARLIESIPVERAEDVSVAGAGLVWISPEDRVTVLGRGTRFTAQVKPNDSIVVSGCGGALVVASVVSDEQLLLKKPAPLEEALEQVRACTRAAWRHGGMAACAWRAPSHACTARASAAERRSSSRRASRAPLPRWPPAAAVAPPRRRRWPGRRRGLSARRSGR